MKANRTYTGDGMPAHQPSALSSPRRHAPAVNCFVLITSASLLALPGIFGGQLSIAEPSTLIIHGDEDQHVPLYQALSFAAPAQRAGGVTTLAWSFDEHLLDKPARPAATTLQLK